MAERAVPSDLGARVRAARERRDLDQAALAAAVGITADEIAAIEGGASFSTLQLDAIARATQETMAFFLIPTADVEAVLLRAGAAHDEQVTAAIGVLSRFVHDYDFLRSLEM